MEVKIQEAFPHILAIKKMPDVGITPEKDIGFIIMTENSQVSEQLMRMRIASGMNRAVWQQSIFLFVRQPAE